MAHKNHPGVSSGRTVKARDLQYIQRPADAELLDHCQNGRPAYILHSPQMGKSSLIAHTAERLNTTSHHAVLIDLSQFPLPPREEEWFHTIVRILDDSLDLSTDVMSWWGESTVSALPPHTRLTKLMTEVILPEITKPLVLFIDEIERTVTLPFRKHFFECLTTLYESRETHPILSRLSFVVCGVATPSQLIPEGESLLFQWSHRVVLSDFTLQEALPLAEGISLPSEAAHEAIQWIYRWTNGHPYLTQLLCRVLEEQQRVAWLESEVDDCIRHFIVSPQGLREPNFQFVRTALTEPGPNELSLLEPYYDLLEGNRENLKANPSALEQLRLIGVLRENDKDIAIRNPLYKEVFPPEWVKQHLRPKTSSLPKSQHSYVLAASIFLVGVGLLLWFQLPASRPPTNTVEQHSSTQAQEKIQELEATIARYQQLSEGETQNLIAQRTQLETQLASKTSALADLKSQVATMETALVTQRDEQEATIAGLQIERAQWQTKANTAGKELESALGEMKTLQMALLKKSSLSPSEINKLMADRSQLDTRLKTANTELAHAHERARDLEARLTQQQQVMQTENQQLVEKTVRLEDQIQSAESALHETRLALKATETSAKEQATLARTELARLQKERSDYQEQQRSQQQTITTLESRADALTNALSEKEQTIQDKQQQIAALEIQANALATTLAEKDQSTQHDKQAIARLTSDLQEVRNQEAQARNRITQLDTMLSGQRQHTNDSLLKLQKERDQLSSALTEALANLAAKTNRITTLTTDLTSTKQELSSQHVALRDIHAASSEKNRHAEDQITALSLTSTTLESQLRKKENALHQAQQRIAELETHAKKMEEISSNLEISAQEGGKLREQFTSSQNQLAMAQQQILSLEAALEKQSQMFGVSPNSQPSLSSKDNANVKEIPSKNQKALLASRILKTLSQASSSSIPHHTQLLLARQAFLYVLQSEGQNWASSNQILQEYFPDSAINLRNIDQELEILTFDPHRNRLVGSTKAGTIWIWSLKHPNNSPKKFQSIPTGIRSLTFSPNGKWLAAGGEDNLIRVWDTFSIDTQPKILRGHKKAVTALTFNAKNDRLVSGSKDRLIRLWNLSQSTPESTILGKHSDWVNALFFSHGKQRIVSMGEDRNIQEWDLSNMGTPIRIFRFRKHRLSPLALHPSRKIIAKELQSNQIGIWRLEHPGQPPNTLRGNIGNISLLQFSPKGTYLASISSGNSVRLWNWESGEEPSILLSEGKKTVSAIAISSDNHKIAIAREGHSVIIWPSPDDLAESVCQIAQRNLTLKEWNQSIGDSLTYERTCWNFPLHGSFLEEGRRLAKKGAQGEALAIFNRAAKLDPTLKLAPEKELAKFSP